MEVGLKSASFYKKLYIHKTYFCTCSIWTFIIHCLLLISFHTYCSHTEDLRLTLVSEKRNKKPSKNTPDVCVHVTLSNPNAIAFYWIILSSLWACASLTVCF